MKVIVIQREEWGINSLLRSDNGKRCCLGFACAGYGVPLKDMLNISDPSCLDESFLERKRVPKWMYHEDGHDVKKAMHINDDVHMTMEQKEKLLKPLFAKHRIKLVFKGKRS